MRPQQQQPQSSSILARDQRENDQDWVANARHRLSRIKDSVQGDPMFHRIHPLLYVSCKPTVEVTPSVPISDWMKDAFGVAVMAQTLVKLQELDSLRKAVYEMSRVDRARFTHLTFLMYRQSMVEYIVRLDCLAMKTRGQSDASAGCIRGLAFDWGNWRGKVMPWVRIESLAEESACVLFNLAALYSMAGAILPPNLASDSAPVQIDPCDDKLRAKIVELSSPVQTMTSGAASVVLGGGYHEGWKETKEALAYRCQHFRVAAYLFDLLGARLTKQKISIDDLSPGIAWMFRDVMLAQAQEAAYQNYKQESSLNAASLGVCQSAGVSAVKYYRGFLTGYDALVKASSALEQSLATAASSSSLDDDPSAPLQQQQQQQQQQQHGDPAPPGHENMAPNWVLHCQSVCSALRASLFCHLARQIEESGKSNKSLLPEHGKRVACIGKALDIVKDQIEQISGLKRDSVAVDEAAAEHVASLVTMLSWCEKFLEAYYDMGQRDLMYVYKQPEAKRETLSNIEVMEVMDKVSLKYPPTFTNHAVIEPLFSDRKEDLFSEILSIASVRMLVSYRIMRISRFSEFVKTYVRWNGALCENIGAHPEYLLSYFVSVVSREPVSPPRQKDEEYSLRPSTILGTRFGQGLLAHSGRGYRSKSAEMDGIARSARKVWSEGSQSFRVALDQMTAALKDLRTEMPNLDLSAHGKLKDAVEKEYQFCVDACYKSEAVRYVMATSSSDDKSSTSPPIPASTWDNDSYMAAELLGNRLAVLYRSVRVRDEAVASLKPELLLHKVGAVVEELVDRIVARASEFEKFAMALETDVGVVDTEVNDYTDSVVWSGNRISWAEGRINAICESIENERALIQSLDRMGIDIKELCAQVEQRLSSQYTVLQIPQPEVVSPVVRLGGGAVGSEIAMIEGGALSGEIFRRALTYRTVGRLLFTCTVVSERAMDSARALVDQCNTVLRTSGSVQLHQRSERPRRGRGLSRNQQAEPFGRGGGARKNNQTR